MLGTLPVKAITRELLRQPTAERWPYEISAAIKRHDSTTIRRGSVGRILHHMEREGWLVSHFEPPESVHGRPRRRCYRITQDGHTALTELLGEHSGRPIAV